MDKGFWRWYLGGWKVVFNLKWVKGAGPWFEYILGIAFTGGASTALFVLFSPWWLLLTVPVGVTVVAHGLWRMNKAWNRRFREFSSQPKPETERRKEE